MLRIFTFRHISHHLDGLGRLIFQRIAKFANIFNDISENSGDITGNRPFVLVIIIFTPKNTLLGLSLYSVRPSGPKMEKAPPEGRLKKLMFYSELMVLLGGIEPPTASEKAR
jgi:hypothetical protein